VVARSHRDMSAPNHTIRCMAIQSTARGTEPALIGAAAEAGADIIGTATIGTVIGTADTGADMAAGADTAAEAGMMAKADMVDDETCSSSNSMRWRTFRVEFNRTELEGGSYQRS
jgi:hypothetical protein